MAKKRPKKVTRETMREVILRTLADSGESLLAVSIRAGINHTQLSRFVAGERDLLLANSDKICAALGLILVKDESSSADSTGGADK